MEPMTLGSAPSSPASPGVNPNFLPGFLMGDPQPSSPNLNTSPGRNRQNSGNFGRVSLSSDPRNLRQKLFNQSLSEHVVSPVQQQSPFLPLSEKAGPPKQSLFDTIDMKKKGAPLSSTVAHFGEQPSFNESFSRLHEDTINMSRNVTIQETAINNSFMNRMDKIDTHWVTVFGFPPSAMALVLAQLSNCGTIVDKQLPPQGNWLHIKFNTITEVSRALNLNGKCLNNSIMIGVSLYYNVKDNKENNVSFTSPIRARSLRQSFTSPSLNNSIISSHNVPQKSTGLVTKAMEYVFGW